MIQLSENGYYGSFGGAYIPEMLYPNVKELQENYLSMIYADDFQREFHYLLKDGNPYNIELKNATDSFYLIQLIYNWNNNKVINYIMNKTNWGKMYGVKLTKSNRNAIEDKEAYVRKIDSL
jgi:hypothetical protein